MDRAELIHPASLSIDGPVAFVDIETTGGYAGLHRIIDIAVIGATGDRLDFEWQTLVSPGVRIPAGITALTGIDDDMLADAPPFERVAKELRERLAGRVFVAHNVRFDYGFIRREFARMESEWRSANLCTVRLSRALYPGMPRHNLDAVMEHHGFTIEKRHRAMPDAQVLWQLWQKLRKDWSREELQAAIERAAPRVVMPPQLSPDLPEDLPERPGVYRFFGEGEQGETLLYVGKANNLRERVLDHFRNGVAVVKSQRLAAQVRRVEWSETAGELGALLLEAREIRERQPVYNRQLRSDGERLTWLFDDAGGPPQLVALDAQVLGTGNAFGTWRSERDARRALESLAREHRWCFKLLGLESPSSRDGAGSCFGLQVGRCNGACVGKEPPAAHLARVKIALMPQRLKPWPHQGPMMWREGSGERAQFHVIDGWQHLGSFDCADEDALLHWRRRPSSTPFDMDAYRILTRQLRDARLLPVPRS
ncbi:MAG TPA: exonuclease domain-containing protein [Steroidobacteraceae bacterium]|nr:exonuclease domain-containing protein [Steroidobacteraceae bacterium]